MWHEARKQELVILLDKTTNPQNSELDVAHIDSFCCTVRNEPSSTVFATKLLADRIQSANSNESLNALNLLDECMGKCGDKFQNTVGTFRFLNELVKLVSFKYLGAQTSPQVKTKILDLLLLWTIKYPHQSKIKEAYEMLRRQGVEHESPNPIRVQKINTVASSPLNFPSQTTATTPKRVEDPTSLKIKQLIQSKNPGKVDIHAANLLIQNFYEIEKKKTLRVEEIKKGKEKVLVLNEMLDNCNVTDSSADDIALIRELYEACRYLQPTIFLLTEDQNQDEQVLQEALETNDLLMQVIQKYESTIMQTDATVEKSNGPGQGNENELDDVLIDMRINGSSSRNSREVKDELESGMANDMGALVDIFGNIPREFQENPLAATQSGHANILQHRCFSQKEEEVGLIRGHPKKEAVSVHLNPEVKATPKDEIDTMISEMMKSTSLNQSILKPLMLPTPVEHDHAFEDITIDLENIEPSDLPARIIVNEPKGLKVILNFTKEYPKENIAVVVATVVNQSSKVLTEIDLQLQPDHKDCQVKHLDSAVRSLAGMKPFRAAVEDIAWIILVWNPKQVKVSNWSVTIKYLSNGVAMKNQVVVNDLPHLF